MKIKLNFILKLPDSELFSHKSDNSHAHGKHTIGVADEYYYCVIDERKYGRYFYFFSHVWPYIDLSAYAILPFCIMFVCNIAIIKNAKFSTSILTYTSASLPVISEQNQNKQPKSPLRTTTTIIIPPTPTSETVTGAGTHAGHQATLMNGKSSISVASSSSSTKSNIFN